MPNVFRNMGWYVCQNNGSGTWDHIHSCSISSRALFKKKLCPGVSEGLILKKMTYLTPPRSVLSAFHQMLALIFDRQQVRVFLLAEESNQKTRLFNHWDRPHDWISAGLNSYIVLYQFCKVMPTMNRKQMCSEKVRQIVSQRKPWQIKDEHLTENSPGLRPLNILLLWEACNSSNEHFLTIHVVSALVLLALETDP